MLSRQALHKEADRARFYSHLIGDEEAANRLRQYAAELDAMAEATEPAVVVPLKRRCRSECGSVPQSLFGKESPTRGFLGGGAIKLGENGAYHQTDPCGNAIGYRRFIRSTKK